MVLIHKYSVRFDFLKALSMTYAVLLHLTPCMLLVVSERICYRRHLVGLVAIGPHDVGSRYFLNVNMLLTE